MKTTLPNLPWDVSPYLLKRLRRVEEAVAEIQHRPLRSSLRRRRDALARRAGREQADEPEGT